MIASILTLLIYLVVLGIIGYLVVYVLGVLGITLPPRVVQLVGVLILLLVVLWFFTSAGTYALPRLIQ